MTWLRLDAALWTHPKIRAAGEPAAWLYVCGLCYCQLHATGGHIPRQALASLSPSTHRARSAKSLVAAGLWVEVGAGWDIHDFKDWQYAKPEKRPSTSENSANGEADIEHFRARAPHARARARAGADARAQNRTEQKREGPPSPLKGGTPIPVYPVGGRQRDQRAFREGCAAYAVEHLPNLPDGSRAVQQAVRYGHAETLEQVKAFIAQHWSSEK